MDRENIETLFRVWVVVALVTGIAFITVGPPSLGVAGVVLIILGLVSLMPAFRSFTEVDV